MVERRSTTQRDREILELRRERQRRGWSLTRVTQLTGIASNDLSMLERGLRPVFPGWRRRIAEAFGLPEEALFRGEETQADGTGRRGLGRRRAFPSGSERAD